MAIYTIKLKDENANYLYPQTNIDNVVGLRDELSNSRGMTTEILTGSHTNVTEPKTNTLYFEPIPDSTAYNVMVYVDDSWKKVSTTDTDLSIYASKKLVLDLTDSINSVLEHIIND